MAISLRYHVIYDGPSANSMLLINCRENGNDQVAKARPLNEGNESEAEPCEGM